MRCGLPVAAARPTNIVSLGGAGSKRSIGGAGFRYGGDSGERAHPRLPEWRSVEWWQMDDTLSRHRFRTYKRRKVIRAVH